MLYVCLKSNFYIKLLILNIRLNNQTHSVYTGIALINSNLEIEKFHVKTEVKFGKITDSMLQSYVKSGEAMLVLYLIV